MDNVVQSIAMTSTMCDVTTGQTQVSSGQKVHEFDALNTTDRSQVVAGVIGGPIMLCNACMHSTIIHVHTYTFELWEPQIQQRFSVLYRTCYVPPVPVVQTGIVHWLILTLGPRQ